MLSVPYVTENTRIHILLPVHTDEKEDALQFLKQYKQICIEKKEKTMLMLVSLKIIIIFIINIISYSLSCLKVSKYNFLICRYCYMMLMLLVKVKLMIFLNS